MHAARPQPSIRSLADARDGDSVRVGDIVFDTIRRLCPALGLAAGDVVRCERRTPQAVVLRRRDGGCVEIDPFYAAFIEAHPSPPGA